jgi:hypothetical protein
MAKHSQNKTVPTDISVKDYLSGIKNELQRKDAEELAHIMERITGKPGVVWGESIIGFDQVHYKYNSGRVGDMGAIGFAPRKTNLTIYLVDGTSKYVELLNKLGPHNTGKVCLYIKRLSDIDLTILEELIRDSYQYVVAHKNDMHKTE